MSIGYRWEPGYVRKEEEKKIDIEIYEYLCPHCGIVNHRLSKTKRVVCNNCRKAFMS